jgi:hypothetical protein
VKQLGRSERPLSAARAADQIVYALSNVVAVILAAELLEVDSFERFALATAVGIFVVGVLRSSVAEVEVAVRSSRGATQAARPELTNLILPALAAVTAASTSAFIFGSGPLDCIAIGIGFFGYTIYDLVRAQIVPYGSAVFRVLAVDLAWLMTQLTLTLALQPTGFMSIVLIWLMPSYVAVTLLRPSISRRMIHRPKARKRSTIVGISVILTNGAFPALLVIGSYSFESGVAGSMRILQAIFGLLTVTASGLITYGVASTARIAHAKDMTTWAARSLAGLLGLGLTIAAALSTYRLVVGDTGTSLLSATAQAPELILTFALYRSVSAWLAVLQTIGRLPGRSAPLLPFAAINFALHFTFGFAPVGAESGAATLFLVLGLLILLLGGLQLARMRHLLSQTAEPTHSDHYSGYPSPHSVYQTPNTLNSWGRPHSNSEVFESSALHRREYGESRSDRRMVARRNGSIVWPIGIALVAPVFLSVSTNLSIGLGESNRLFLRSAGTTNVPLGLIALGLCALVVLGRVQRSLWRPSNSASRTLISLYLFYLVVNLTALWAGSLTRAGEFSSESILFFFQLVLPLPALVLGVWAGDRGETTVRNILNVASMFLAIWCSYLILLTAVNGPDDLYGYAADVGPLLNSKALRFFPTVCAVFATYSLLARGRLRGWIMGSPLLAVVLLSHSRLAKVIVFIAIIAVFILTTRSAHQVLVRLSAAFAVGLVVIVMLSAGFTSLIPSATGIDRLLARDTAVQDSNAFRFGAWRDSFSEGLSSPLGRRYIASEDVTFESQTRVVSQVAKAENQFGEAAQRAGPVAFVALALVVTLPIRRLAKPTRASPDGRTRLTIWLLSVLVAFPVLGSMFQNNMSEAYAAPLALFLLGAAAGLSDQSSGAAADGFGPTSVAGRPGWRQYAPAEVGRSMVVNSGMSGVSDRLLA